MNRSATVDCVLRVIFLHAPSIIHRPSSIFSLIRTKIVFGIVASVRTSVPKSFLDSRWQRSQCDPFALHSLAELQKILSSVCCRRLLARAKLCCLISFLLTMTMIRVSAVASCALRHYGHSANAFTSRASKSAILTASATASSRLLPLQMSLFTTVSVPEPPTSNHKYTPLKEPVGGSIIYTETDEAPALATYSLYPIIRKVNRSFSFIAATLL